MRAETPQAVRGRRFDDACDVLVNVGLRCDGNDLAYPESLGIGAGHDTQALWEAIGQNSQPGEPAKWPDTFARLTWRLMPEAAVDALKARAVATNLSGVQPKFAFDSIAFIQGLRRGADGSRRRGGAPVRAHCSWWLQNRSEGQ